MDYDWLNFFLNKTTISQWNKKSYEYGLYHQHICEIKKIYGNNLVVEKLAVKLQKLPSDSRDVNWDSEDDSHAGIWTRASRVSARYPIH